MDVFSRKKRSAVMRRIRSKENRSTEQRFIRVLREFGITGWRRNYPLAGKPDFVFPEARVAVFIDGCFWHKCPLCYDGHVPQQNESYWGAKLDRNVRRDRKVSRFLRRAGWRVFRFRECRLSRSINSVFLALVRG